MPMNWTTEANAKLFLGVLDQIKDQGVKLNYQKLAEYMGPDCTNRAIDHQIQKLKKVAGAGDSTAGVDNGDTTTAAGADGAPATPTKTPTKRRAGGGKRNTPAKKRKGQAGVADGNGDDEVERQILNEVKRELNDLE